MNYVDIQTTVKQFPNGDLYVDVENVKYHISSTAQNVALGDEAHVYAISKVNGTLWFMSNATHVFAVRCASEFMLNK